MALFTCVCDGGKLKLYNDKGSFTKEIPLGKPVPELTQGKHSLKFDCEFPDESQLKIRAVFKTMSSPEVIK